jgi:hypothetical protein
MKSWDMSARDVILPIAVKDTLAWCAKLFERFHRF